MHCPICKRELDDAAQSRKSGFYPFCSERCRLIDLGGATGHLAIAACQRYSELEGIVFDLPDAMPLAREIVGHESAAVSRQYTHLSTDDMRKAMQRLPDVTDHA